MPRLLLLPALPFLLVAAASFAQSAPVAPSSAPVKRALIVNGRTADNAVADINGTNYVDLETFAQLTGALVKIESNRVTMIFPVERSDNKAPSQAAAEASDNAFSKDFARTAIASLADMREWRGAIASAIRFGVAAGTWLGPWLQDYRTRAEQSLNQASVSASTSADQRALQLLRNQFSNVREWDTTTEATIQSLNAEKSISQSSAQNDPLLAKVAECGSFLNSMLVSGELGDNQSCH